MNQARMVLIGGALGLALGGFAVWLIAAWMAPPADAWWRGELETCPPGVDPAAVDEAVALGRGFLLTHQKPRGDFTYEYDWSTATDSDDNNEVRQSGAAWGLALVYADKADAEARDAAVRAIAFWDGRSRTDAKGRRWTVYPGATRGQTGTVALVALAHVEVLRRPEMLRPEIADRLRENLDGYLRFIRSMRMAEGGFADSYRLDDGMPALRRANPYADGECLLLLVKAAKYLGGDRLWDEVDAFAAADHERWVVTPRAAEPDPDKTKGYYQWGSMSWWELADAGRDAEVWGDRLVELAVWMIDDHRTLLRRKNTAYAYEGMISAWDWARRTDDPRRDKIECVIEQGLPKLLTWQIGHSTALPTLAAAEADPRAVGGVQNAADEAPLRIDVVQHQTHALLLARRYGVPDAR